jgi:hypothetical protein
MERGKLQVHRAHNWMGRVPRFWDNAWTIRSPLLPCRKRRSTPFLADALRNIVTLKLQASSLCVLRSVLQQQVQLDGNRHGFTEPADRIVTPATEKIGHDRLSADCERIGEPETLERDIWLGLGQPAGINNCGAKESHE